MTHSDTIERSALLAGDAASPARARRFVEETLAACSWDHFLDEATLLVTELVSNAVFHAGSEVELRVRLEDEVLRVEAHDSSPVLPSPRHYEDDALTGRGLAMVELVAADWGVEPTPTGKAVWFELCEHDRLGGAGGAADPSGSAPASRPEPEGPVDASARSGAPGPYVRLLGAPVRLFIAAHAHTDALLREMRLLGAHDERAPLAAAELGPAVEQAHAARASGEEVVDAAVPLPLGAVAGRVPLADLLDEADDRARRGELLTSPALPEVRALRHWYLDQVTAQVRGEPPTGWRPAGEPQQGPARALAEIGPGAILDRLSDAVVVADESNSIVYVNPAAEDLLGWPRGELSGQRLVSVIPPRFRDAHVAGFTQFLLTGVGRILGRPVRVPALRRDGREIEVELGLAALVADGGRPLVVASLRDLTDRIELEHTTALADLLQVVSDVAILLGGRVEEGSIEPTVAEALRLLAGRLDCQFGALWTVEDEEVLTCAAAWRAGSVASAFEAASRRRRFPVGVGLPGRVWSSGEPAWLFDVVEEPNFPRAGVARQEGLHGALAFPVHCDRSVLGVVELLSEQPREPDPALLAAVAVVGRHLGLFLERSRS